MKNGNLILAGIILVLIVAGISMLDMHYVSQGYAVRFLPPSEWNIGASYTDGFVVNRDGTTTRVSADENCYGIIAVSMDKHPGPGFYAMAR
jgi:hypothetical protein